jgi:hypothetical protein
MRSYKALEQESLYPACSPPHITVFPPDCETLSASSSSDGPWTNDTFDDTSSLRNTSPGRVPISGRSLSPERQLRIETASSGASPSIKSTEIAGRPHSVPAQSLLASRCDDRADANPTPRSSSPRLEGGAYPPNLAPSVQQPSSAKYDGGNTAAARALRYLEFLAQEKRTLSPSGSSISDGARARRARMSDASEISVREWIGRRASDHPGPDRSPIPRRHTVSPPKSSSPPPVLGRPRSSSGFR